MKVWCCKCNATELGTVGCKRHSSAQAGQSGAKKGRESGRRLVRPTPEQQLRCTAGGWATSWEPKRNTANRQGKKAETKAAKRTQHQKCNSKPTPAQELAKAASQADKQPSQKALRHSARQQSKGNKPAKHSSTRNVTTKPAPAQ